MKKTLAMLMAVMMLAGMIQGVFAEGDSEVIEAPAPVVEEQPAPEPAPVVKEEPAPAPAPQVKEEPAPVPAAKEEPAPAPAVKEEPAPAPVVEEKPAEKPAEEAPAPASVTEEKVDPAPVEEAPAPVVEEKPAEQPVEEVPAAPAEETVPAEQPAEAPAEETPAEPVEEVPAPVEEVPVEQPAAPVQEVVIEQKEVFAGRLTLDVVNKGAIYAGDEVVLKAKVQGANLGYSIRWETFDTTSTDLNETWKTVASGEKFTFTANAAATLLMYRARLVAEDGTELYSTEFFFTLSVKEEPAMNPAEEAVPAEEVPAAEEPAEEVPAVEEPVAEEPVEETVAEEVPAAPAEETPVAEEPAEEIPAVEEPAEEAPEAVPAAEEPAEKPYEEISTVTEQKAPEAPAEETKPEKTAPAPAEDEVILLDLNTETKASEEIDEYDTPLGLTEPQTIAIEGEVEINVREGADGLAAIFETLPEGAEVTVVNVEGDWATVVVNDELGYIYIDDIAEYLELEEEPEESAEDPEETAEKAAEEVTETPKKVTIFTSRRRVMEAGEPVYLTSKIEGFEECAEIMYVWYVDKGNGFEVVEGANEDTYTFTADAESLSWGWKLTVLYR